MKKKKNEIIKSLEPSFIFAGGAIGSSILGGALQSKLPAGISNPLTTTGLTMSKFVGPIAILGVTDFTMKKFKKLEKKMKKTKK